jgi:uncharacterized protein YdaU (DUF1376 family)
MTGNVVLRRLKASVNAVTKRPYMPLYIDRWRGGTEAISPKHRGPYLDVLCAIWNGGGSLKNDPRVLMSASRLDKRQFASFWAECSGKFLISADVVQHATVTEMVTRSDNFAAKMQQNRFRRKKKPETKQEPKKQNSDYTNQRFVFSLTGENTNLAIDHESSSATASPPSPEMGGGDATDGEHIRALNRWLQGRIHGLMVSNVLTGRDVRELKEAVRGGSEDRLLLAPGYLPPDHVAAALASLAIDFDHLPKLKLITGD